MFLICGEALFDFFTGTDDGTGPMHFEAVAGGSPFNVGIGLARLGRVSAEFDAWADRAATQSPGASDATVVSAAGSENGKIAESALARRFPAGIPEAPCWRRLTTKL